jgi:hypothetical protein
MAGERKFWLVYRDLLIGVKDGFLVLFWYWYSSGKAYLWLYRHL